MPSLRDLLAPPSCLACGSPGHDLCPACRRALPWLPEPRCRRCGLPDCAGTAGARSGRSGCPAAGQAFAAAWAPVAYAGPVPDLVRALKLRRTRIASETMVAAMAHAPAWLLAPPTPGRSPAPQPGRSESGPPGGLTSERAPQAGALVALVPVPTARARARSRGFDQAALLARGLATRGVGEYSPFLERRGVATRQRGAGRTERLAAGRIEVRVRAGVAVPPLCVLVDDVHTTGATFDACARPLLAAGAERVVALAYARALP